VLLAFELAVLDLQRLLLPVTWNQEIL